MVNVAAAGIAELEAVSSRYIEHASATSALDFWIMDFFRWPYMRHTRMNYQCFLGNLDRLPLPSEQVRHYRQRLGKFKSWLKTRAAEARNSVRCICHLDYAAKNMLMAKNGLYLIDWSEVKIGRIGFDGGDYLSKLFIHTDLESFHALRKLFEQEYALAVDDDDLLPIAHRNRQYLFAILALWRCLQRQVIDVFIDKEQSSTLLDKLDYLLAEPEREWRADRDSQAEASHFVAGNVVTSGA